MQEKYFCQNLMVAKTTTNLSRKKSYRTLSENPFGISPPKPHIVTRESSLPTACNARINTTVADHHSPTQKMPKSLAWAPLSFYIAFLGSAEHTLKPFNNALESRYNSRSHTGIPSILTHS